MKSVPGHPLFIQAVVLGIVTALSLPDFWRQLFFTIGTRTPGSLQQQLVRLLYVAAAQVCLTWKYWKIMWMESGWMDSSLAYC